MHTFVLVILRLNLNVDIKKSNTRVQMAVPSMRSCMLEIILNVNFVIKVFQFPKGLKDRRKIHTGKLKYQCTNCTDSYTTNRAMLLHALKHQG